jgi:hypothetical protein
MLVPVNSMIASVPVNSMIANVPVNNMIANASSVTDDDLDPTNTYTIEPRYKSCKI